MIDIPKIEEHLKIKLTPIEHSHIMAMLNCFGFNTRLTREGYESAINMFDIPTKGRYRRKLMRAIFDYIWENQ